MRPGKLQQERDPFYECLLRTLFFIDGRPGGKGLRISSLSIPKRVNFRRSLIALLPAGQLLQGSEPLPAEEEKDLAKQKILENQQLVQLLALTPDGEEIEQRKMQNRTQLQTLEKKHDRFIDSSVEISPATTC